MTDPSIDPSPADPSKPRCTARTGKGQPCRRWPVKGGTVCASHGGRAPQVKAAAKQRLAEQAAAQALATYGHPVDTNPIDALLEEVRWTAGHVSWLRERVQEQEKQALIWGTTKTVDKDAGENSSQATTEAAVPNAWLKLYQAERKHLVEVCRVAIAAGIEERKVRLAEQQGEVIVGVIQAILDGLSLSPEQEARVPDVVPAALRAVA